jgi:hypothetical protein
MIGNLFIGNNLNISNDLKINLLINRNGSKYQN